MKLELVKTWAFSSNTLGLIDREVKDYFQNENERIPPRRQKKEKSFAIKRDNSDQTKIRAVLKHLINFLNETQVNITKNLSIYLVTRSLMKSVIWTKLFILKLNNSLIF